MGKFLTRLISAFIIIFSTSDLLLALPTSQQAAVRGGDVRIKTEGGKEVALYRESHALIIGISDYVNGWDDLSGVKEDVPAVKAVLEKHFFKVEVEENLTGQQLEAAIKKFIRRHGESQENRLLIYFAGHGHTLTTSGGVRVGYIVPRDAPNPARNLAQFKEVALSMNQIQAYAVQIESKHAMFVFDSCFAGTIFDSTRAERPPIIAKLASQPVRQFITAGAADEVVPNKSLFREQFIVGLNGAADGDDDGYITGSELGIFLQNRVTNYTHGAHSPQWGKIKHPRLDDGEFLFQLSRVAAKIEAGGTTDVKTATDNQKTAELMYWDFIKNSTNPEDFKAYLEEYPKGFFVKLARNRLVSLLADTFSMSTKRVDPGGAAVKSDVAPPPSQVAHGPKDLAPNTVYLLGSNKIGLVLRASVVNTNNDDALNQIVSKFTREIGASGSHVGDGEWYYWRLRGNVHLLLSWGTVKSQGWVLVQKNEGAWWYKINNGQWKHMKNGKSEEEWWAVEGYRVSITIELPAERVSGWTSDDIKYKLGVFKL